MAILKPCPKVLAHLLSLKVLLVVAFIALMVVAGFLGFYLTYLQGQRSLHDLAEVDMVEAARSVQDLIVSKLVTGHQLNIMESLYFLHAGLRMDDFVNAWTVWRPLTIAGMLSASDTFSSSNLVWPGLPGQGRGMAFQGLGSITAGVFLSFNSTVCNDTVHFPGSNCSVRGLELYTLDPSTLYPLWGDLRRYLPDFDAMQLPTMRTGVYSRSSTWRSSPNNLFNPGYAEVSFMPPKPGVLLMECNVCVLDDQGYCVGQLGKDLLLRFLNDFLHAVVVQSSLLSKGGRVFSYEGSGLLTGASHGSLIEMNSDGSNGRLAVWQSDDATIAFAGQRMRELFGPLFIAWSNLTERNFTMKFGFSLDGESFAHFGQTMALPYGMVWQVGVVISETQLLADITAAAQRMLGYTGGAIAVLAVCAALLISYLVTAPLIRLCGQMEQVAEMD
eukprot:RCo052986